LIIWATILGASGAFLAIPLSLFVKSLFVDVDPEHDWVAPLLSSGSPNDKPAAPSPDAAAEPESAKPEAAGAELEPAKPTEAEAP
jgi:hypothetical protein